MDVMVVLDSVWQSLCPSLVACRDRRNVPGDCAAAGKHRFASNTERDSASVVIRAVWSCQAASLPSSAKCDVIRKEKGVNGLFLPKSLCFLQGRRQTRNNHRDQNRHPVASNI